MLACSKDMDLGGNLKEGKVVEVRCCRVQGQVQGSVGAI